MSLGVVGAHAGVESVFGSVVTENYFTVLGAVPAAGRVFGAADSSQPEASPIVVLGYRFWARRFNKDPRIIGRAVTINGQNYFKLMLDINEPNGAKSTITLDQLQFYTSATGSMTTTTLSSLGTLRYSFSAGDMVNMDAARNHGSGSGDMFAAAYVASRASGYAPTAAARRATGLVGALLRGRVS